MRTAARLGRTRLAVLGALCWALPLSAWAGTVDLDPGPLTWAALYLGLALLLAWLVLLTQLWRIPAATGPRRLDLAAMSRAERAWNLALAGCGVGLVGWLNGAATVDWGPLFAAVAAARPGAVLLGAGLLVLLGALGAGAWVSWRRSAEAFALRSARASSG